MRCGGLIKHPKTLRFFTIATLIPLLRGVDPAQGQPTWQYNEEAAVAAARQQGKPLVFFFITDEERHERAEDNRLDNRREAVRRAFNDPAVAALCRRAYIAVQADVKQEGALKRQLKAKTLGVTMTTPDGEVLGQLDARAARDPKQLLEALQAATVKYAQLLYQKEIKPVLENPQTKPAVLQKALTRLRNMEVEGADHDLVQLLKREELDPSVRVRIFEILAAYSTEPAIGALLEQAETFKPAEDALRKCPPRALKPLVAHLNGSDAAQARRAYRAIVAICRTSAKPDEFWDTASAEEREKEIKRVTLLAEKKVP